MKYIPTIYLLIQVIDKGRSSTWSPSGYVSINTGLTFRLSVFLFFFLTATITAIAQDKRDTIMRISLKEAIQIAKVNNKLLKTARIEKQATDEDLKDVKASILPSLNVSGSYQRFTELTLYTRGLSDRKSVPKIPGPNGADLGVSANFNLYSGGRTKSLQYEQLYRAALADVSVAENAGNMALQVASQYLDMIRLNSQQLLLKDQIIRAETRLRNIQALYRNQKVTRSDVLRAELMLSNIRLLLEQNQNDIKIANIKLGVLMDLPERVMIEPTDTLNGEKRDLGAVESQVSTAPTDAFGVIRFNESIKIQEARIKGVKSNYYPALSVYSAYGINYPNTIFSPAVDQAYSIGFIGLKLQYNLSSLYHNKYKVSAANIRLKQLEMQRSALASNIGQEAKSLGIKYREAINRISVIQKQIEQAAVNYKIISSKYFNQLALLTDLLDADNLYQESRYNLIQAKAALELISYQLQYTSGKL